MTNPLISIIIATYNAEKTIQYALDSVKNQIFNNWECIIIDGDSTDTTISIVKKLSENDDRFYYISEPDDGIYDAFNKGWKIAKGKWIYYLGADDKIMKDALIKLPLNNPFYDIIYGDIIFHNKRGNIHFKSSPVNKLKGKMISHQSIIMKKELIYSLKGFNMNYKICSDFDLFQRALLRNVKVIYLPIEIAVFEAGGASSNGFIFLKERFIMHKKYGSLFFAVYDILLEYFKITCRSLLK